MAAADVAVIIELSGQDGLRFDCDNATSISKGTLLVISADIGVTKSAATADQRYAGVAVADKVAGDGSTKIAVHTPGQSNIFDMKCDVSTVSAGVMVCLSGINTIRNMTDSEFEMGQCIGQSYEEGAGGDVIRVRS